MHIRSRIAFCLLCCVVLSISACQEEAPEPTVEPATQTPIATPTRPASVNSTSAITTTPSAVTESTLVRIRDSKKLRIGVLYNYPPLGYLTPDGKIAGYEADLMRSIAEHWGVEPIFVQVTRQTRLPMLVDGQVDVLAAAMPHRRDLEPFAEFSETTFNSGYTGLVVSASGITSVSALTSLPVVAVGTEAGVAFNTYVTSVGGSPQVQIVEDTIQAEALLSAGSVQAIVGRRESLILATADIPDSVVLTDYIDREPYGFAVRRGDTPLRDLIDLTLQIMASDNSLGQIYGANFLGNTPDSFLIMPGDPTFTFTDFPTAIAGSDSVMNRLRAGEPLRIAGLSLAQTPAPFDGQPIVDGLNRALINEMARRWNVPVIEIPDSAGDAGLALLQAENADIVVGVRSEKSKIGLVAFSSAYYKRGLRLLHMNDVAVEGINDLEAVPALAAPPVAVSEDIIRDNNSIPHVRTTESFEDAFASLTGRGVYALVGDEFSLDLMAQADDRIEVAEDVYRPVGYVMALPALDADFLALVNYTLQDIQRDGTLQLLLEQYFKPYFPAGQEVEVLDMEYWPGVSSNLGFGY